MISKFKIISVIGPKVVSLCLYRTNSVWLNTKPYAIFADKKKTFAMRYDKS